MSEDRFDALRTTYRSRWDAYQVIAHQNAQLLQAGNQPSNEQLADEREAVAAVERARSDLLAALARLGN